MVPTNPRNVLMLAQNQVTQANEDYNSAITVICNTLVRDTLIALAPTMAGKRLSVFMTDEKFGSCCVLVNNQPLYFTPDGPMLRGVEDTPMPELQPLGDAIAYCKAITLDWRLARLQTFHV